MRLYRGGEGRRPFEEKQEVEQVIPINSVRVIVGRELAPPSPCSIHEQNSPYCKECSDYERGLNVYEHFKEAEEIQKEISGEK